MSQAYQVVCVLLVIKSNLLKYETLSCWLINSIAMRCLVTVSHRFTYPATQALPGAVYSRLLVTMLAVAEEAGLREGQ